MPSTLLLATTLLAGACAEPEPHVASQDQPIWNGSTDDDSPTSNAVVGVGGCSGTLISSTLVLTAAHCVTGIGAGFNNPGGPSVVLGTPIQLGPNGLKVPAPDEAIPTMVPSRVMEIRSIIATPVVPGDQVRDLAILVVYPPVVEVFELNGPSSFIVPARPTFPAVVDLAFPSGAIAATLPIKLAGWGAIEGPANCATGTLVRRTNAWPDGKLMTANPAGSWDVDFGIEGTYRGTDCGDSGGPLLWLSGDPSLVGEIIGVVSTGGGDHASGAGGTRFTSTLWNGNRAWIEDTAADPNRPGKWLGETDYVGACDFASDPDCDRYYDTLPGTTKRGSDNCPGLYNPAQLGDPDANLDGVADLPMVDVDQDGIPEYCDDNDTCAWGLPDPDGDGLCGELDAQCPYDPSNDGDLDKICDQSDNCPATANTNQTNCNLEAEKATGASRMGDACDPVPCPDFSFKTVTSVTLSEYSKSTKTVLLPVNNLVMRPIGSHASNGDEIAIGAMTEHRFCLTREDHAVFAPVPCFSAEAINDNLAEVAYESESATTVFHRVTLEGQPRQDSNLWLEHDQDLAPVVVTWDHQRDFADWSVLLGWHDYQWVDDPYGATLIGRGRYWVHSVTDAGLAGSSLSTGVHRDLGETVEMTRDLANHYQEIWPSKHWTEYKDGSGIKPFELDLCQGAECNDLPSHDCLVCGLSKASEIYEPAEIRVVGKLPGGEPGIMGAGGGFLPLEAGEISPGFLSLWNDPTTLFVRAVEPNRLVGRGIDMPQTLALDGATFALRGGLAVRGEAITTAAELVDRLSPSQTGLLSAALATGAAEPDALPTARIGATTVYSAYLGKAFVIGGLSRPGGPYRLDAWSLDLETPGASWRRLPEATTGIVIAATYSYADGQLWVLDRIVNGSSRWAMRLRRMDPDTGAATEVAQWPWSSAYNKQWLVLDQDGGVLLASSSSRTRQHAIVRFTDQGRPVVDGMRWGVGDLARPPIVDRDGYNLITVGNGYTKERVRSLELAPASLAEVGRCL